LHRYPFLLGSSFRQVFVILGTMLPMVCYALLLRRSIIRRVPFYERAAVIFFALATVLLGLASGWLGVGAAVIMVSGCVLLDTRYRIPKAAILLVVAYILFLQPTKEQFRSVYGVGGKEDVSRASDWISLSYGMWSRSWVHSDANDIRHQIFWSMGRFFLLPQSANVMVTTPNIVPYQGWRMYNYMAYTLIPRAIWNDKPTVNDANRFYQVTYGLTAERNLDGVSIAVGTLTESYISFGWIGAILVMAFIGVVLDCLGAVFLSRDSGWLAKGIGMALLPNLVSTESQMAQYLGGIVQQIFLVVVVFTPVAVWHSRRVAPLPRLALHRFRRMYGNLGGAKVRGSRATALFSRQHP